jgi:hypothetical protein
MTLDGNSPASFNRFTIDDEHAYSCFVRISARRDTGSDQAFFVRQLVIERTSGTVALEGSVQTVGTDINPAGWSISLTADNTNKSLKLEVTGASSTNIRWLSSKRSRFSTPTNGGTYSKSLSSLSQRHG